MTRPRHYVFAGGGSGGHLTPALAVAEHLLAEDCDARVSFLTSGRTIDAKVMQHSEVAANKRCSVLPLAVTQPPSIRPSGWRHGVSLLKSIHQCRRFLRSQAAAVVIGSGAFASVPGLLAARALHIPTVVFEANSLPGRVNRWWASRAALRLAGFPAGTTKELCGYEPTGMPLGKTPPFNDTNKRQILIVGGSQGSQRLNSIVAEALGEIELPHGWTVLHQTGASSVPPQDSSPSLDRVTTAEFIPNIIEQMSQSAFVISRAGAVTIAEMAATSCPAILVPLSSAADRHQQSNAQFLSDHGAAMMIDESSSRANSELRRAMLELIGDQSARDSMSVAMGSLHRAGAALDIARRLKALTNTAISQRRHD